MVPPECGTNKAMTRRSDPRTPPPPLDERHLRELALRYVGRFATTRMRLVQYLQRKLRERGWNGAGDPALASLAEQLAGLGYIDDEAYATAKGQALGRRGFGKRRVTAALRQAGIDEDDGRVACEHADAGALVAAVRFAQRKRLGPFAIVAPDPRQRDKALAALLRAGHPFDLARRLLDLPAGTSADPDVIVRLLVN